MKFSSAYYIIFSTLYTLISQKHSIQLQMYPAQANLVGLLTHSLPKSITTWKQYLDAASHLPKWTYGTLQNLLASLSLPYPTQEMFQ